MDQADIDERNEYLANLHKTMSLEEVRFIKGRGFEVVHGIPWKEEERNRPYICLRVNGPTEIKTSELSCISTMGTLDTIAIPTESLTGMIEEMMISLNNRQKENLFGTYFPCPAEERIRIYTDNPNWDKALDNLLTRYQ